MIQGEFIDIVDRFMCAEMPKIMGNQFGFFVSVINDEFAWQ